MNRIQPKQKPSPTAAGLLRVAISETWAHEIFVDHHGDRFDLALKALADYFDGAMTKEQAQAQVFSLLEDSALDYFGDDIPEDEYNEAIMPGFLLKRQAS